MKQSSALIWKEWREHRIFLLGGFAVFLLLSSIEYLLYVLKASPSQINWESPTVVVLFLGGLLAVIVAQTTMVQSE